MFIHFTKREDWVAASVQEDQVADHRLVYARPSPSSPMTSNCGARRTRMLSMSRSKRVFWRSSYHGYCAKLSDFFRQAVAFWSQKVVRKGDVHQIPTGQPNTNGWFCRRINQFPLVSAGQICRFAATETTAGLKKTWRNRCGSYLTRVFRWTTQGR